MPFFRFAFLTTSAFWWLLELLVLWRSWAILCTIRFGNGRATLCSILLPRSLVIAWFAEVLSSVLSIVCLLLELIVAAIPCGLRSARLVNSMVPRPCLWLALLAVVRSVGCSWELFCRIRSVLVLSSLLPLQSRSLSWLWVDISLNGSILIILTKTLSSCFNGFGSRTFVLLLAPKLRGHGKNIR